MGSETISEEETNVKVVNRRRVLYLLGWGFIGAFILSVVAAKSSTKELKQ